MSLFRRRTPDETYTASRPRKGDLITYRGEVTGTVHRVEGALCWNAYSDGRDPLPFIWCFKDGLNALHDWPTKIGNKTAAE
jgi:hypothetical protein